MIRRKTEPVKDSYDEIVLSLCQAIKGRMLKGLDEPGDGDKKESWKEEARLKYAEDCERLERLLKVHDDRELAKYVVKTVDSLEKSRKHRRQKLACGAALLAALMVVGAIWFALDFFSTVTAVQVICFLGLETLATCIVYVTFNHLLDAKNSNVNTAQVLESLVSLERSRLEPGNKEREDLLLQLVRQLYPDQ